MSTFGNRSTLDQLTLLAKDQEFQDFLKQQHEKITRLVYAWERTGAVPKNLIFDFRVGLFYQIKRIDESYSGSWRRTTSKLALGLLSCWLHPFKDMVKQFTDYEPMWLQRDINEMIKTVDLEAIGTSFTMIQAQQMIQETCGVPTGSFDAVVDGVGYEFKTVPNASPDLLKIYDHQLDALKYMENTMLENTKACADTGAVAKAPKLIETRTFINGRPAEQCSDEFLFGLIAGQEEQIKKLSAIEHKPDSLIKKIDQMGSDIMALVDFINHRNKE